MDRNFPTLILQVIAVIVAPVIGFIMLGLIRPQQAALDPNHVLAAENPDYILLGNCAASYWIDTSELGKLARGRVSVLWTGSSQGPDWYFQLKNHVLASGIRPRRVVILFENGELTRSVSEEDLQTAFVNWGDEGAATLRRLFLRETDNPWTRLVRWLGSWDPTNLRSLLGDIPSLLVLRSSFSGDQPPSAILTRINHLFDTNSRLARKSPSRGARIPSFQSQLERSVLPRMVQLARQSGLPLAFVRRSVHAAPDVALEKSGYFVALGNYLESQGAPFLDLTRTIALEPQDREASSAEFKLRFTDKFFSVASRAF